MSRVQEFNNPVINGAVNKMYGQVYVLTDLQEKLGRSNASEIDMARLLDVLDFTVGVAREVVNDLHALGCELENDQDSMDVEVQQQQAQSEVTKDIAERNRYMRAASVRQGELASMLGASGFAMDSGSALSMPGDSMEEEQYDGKITARQSLTDILRDGRE